jgi:HK97 gp10 family phage protein
VANTVRSSFQLKGTEEILNNLRNNSEELINIGMDAVSEALDILLQSTIDDCPVGDDVDEEGHLKDSIEKEEPKKYKKKIKGYVKATKPTAIHVEFGTSNMTPRVFLRLQIPKNKNKIRKYIKDKIKSGAGL